MQASFSALANYESGGICAYYESVQHSRRNGTGHSYLCAKYAAVYAAWKPMELEQPRAQNDVTASLRA
eukprot:6192007-Pleurochrysis_carterae.AAC.3